MISSPPYGEARIGQSSGQAQTGHNGQYNADPGQLGDMADAGFSAATSSPPYNLEFSRTHNGKRGGTRGTTPSTPGAFTHYGAVAGQIEGEAPETFWAASRQIVDQVYAGLRPGGHAIWVTKSYVRARERVNFPEQWRRLCEAAGFVTLHEHRAWQIEDTPLVDLDGAEQIRRVEHKGFFRRQNETNGAPRVDYEVVICQVKPAMEDV